MANEFCVRKPCDEQQCKEIDYIIDKLNEWKRIGIPHGSIVRMWISGDIDDERFGAETVDVSDIGIQLLKDYIANWQHDILAEQVSTQTN